jgi:transposase
VDFSEIDFQYVDTPGQKAYPAAMLVRIIILGTIYSIHSSRKLERIVRENIVFMYYQVFKHLHSVLLLLLNVNIVI